MLVLVRVRGKEKQVFLRVPKLAELVLRLVYLSLGCPGCPGSVSAATVYGRPYRGT